MPKRKSPFSFLYRKAKRTRRAAPAKAGRKRLSKSRIRRKGKYSKAINQHVYSRYSAAPTDESITGLELDFAHTFKFNLIKAYTEFSALYDRYRITCVQLQITLLTNPDATLIPAQDPSSSVPWNTTNWYPKFWYCRDYDDSNPISLSDIRERANVKCFVMRPSKMYKINVRPAILNQTYRTELTTGYSPHWKQWIDMANTDVPHYGLKWVFDTQGVDPRDTMPFKIHIEYKYFFTLKDVL